MQRQVFIETFLGQKRMAVLEDGLLVEYAIDRPGSEKQSGSIYKGIVRDILPGIHSAFVHMGLPKNGFLSLDDTAVAGVQMPKDLQEQARSRNGSLRRGQEIVVQLVKETFGEKSPRISQNISLPGTLLVYLPALSYRALSHKITDAAERKRLLGILRGIPADQGGFIVRTAAIGASAEDILREATFLQGLWGEITHRAAYTQAPALLYTDSDLLSRAVRDLLTPQTEAIWLDDPEAFAGAQKLAKAFAPALADRIRFYSENTWMFESLGLSKKLEAATDRTVPLPGGGSIVIDPTEALTAIDVNTGSFVGKHSLEDTVLSVNLAAAGEIARQLRLRDIGGIVVIDFIDMRNPQHEAAVHDALSQALSADRARVHLGSFSKLGLLELTRRQIHKPLHRVLGQECTSCGGSGFSLSLESVARAALRKLQVRIDKKESALFLLAVSPELLPFIQQLGEQMRGNAYVFLDKSRVGAQYDISPAAPSDIPKAALPLGKRN